MKVPAVLVSLALAGVAIAQGAPELPPCAQDCASGFLEGGIGDCGRDVPCICSNDEFLDKIACCLVDVCDASDQAEAVSFAARLCSAVGVTDLPTAVTCATAAPATNTGAATTGTDTVTTTETSPAPTGTDDADETTAATTAATTESANLGPRPTAAAGLGAIGGIIAAVALL